jgi:hypothetical protein
VVTALCGCASFLEDIFGTASRKSADRKCGAGILEKLHQAGDIKSHYYNGVPEQNREVLKVSHFPPSLYRRKRFFYRCF